MELDSIEGLNEVRPAVYRAALKIRSLQKRCQMHLVSVQNLWPVLNSIGGSGDPMIRLSHEDVHQSLEQLFQIISQEHPGQVIPESTDQTTRLLFKLFDRGQTGLILLRSVEAALIVLSGDTLSAKQIALFRLAERYSGMRDRGIINQNGLRVLLEDLSQVPAVVQENHVFGPAETALSSCFSGVTSTTVSEEHFIGWLQSEPRLLLWLSTLYRLSVSEAVEHRVRCHACKAFPITGLRYRCLKCLNVHLCQSCFLTEKRSRKHKPSHPVLEYCTQPSWKESVASLASSARYALLPRHHNQREAEQRRALQACTSAELQYSTLPPVGQSVEVSSTQEASGPDTGLSTATADVTVESKGLQTEEMEGAQRETTLLQRDLSVTQKVMRELQRDKWLLEKEFQVWRVAAQSEHDSLEDKCTELKTMMDALNHHNQQLEEELERFRHVLSLRNRDEFRNEIHPPSHSRLPHQIGENIIDNEWTGPGCVQSHDSFCDEEESKEGRNIYNEERIEKEKRELRLETLYGTLEDISTNLDDTDSLLSQDVQPASGEQFPEEPEEEEALEDQGEGLEFERQDISSFQQHLDACALEECCSSDDSEMVEEEELCDLVQRLRKDLSLYTPTGSDCLQREMLIEAAEGVRDSVSHLVTSVWFDC